MQNLHNLCSFAHSTTTPTPYVCTAEWLLITVQYMEWGWGTGSNGKTEKFCITQVTRANIHIKNHLDVMYSRHNIFFLKKAFYIWYLCPHNIGPKFYYEQSGMKTQATRHPPNYLGHTLLSTAKAISIKHRQF